MIPALVPALGPALAFTLAAAATPAPRQCNTAEHRQFDFWLGDWEVRDAKGVLQGTNRITSEQDGCALFEHWTSSDDPQTGTSMNTFDYRTGRWQQTWIDNRGDLLQLEGGVKDGAMVMQGPRKTPEGKALIERIRWEKLQGGTVRQLWDVSGDGGKTWKVQFEGFYTRKK